MTWDWILFGVYAVAGLLFLAIAYLIGYRSGYDAALDWRRIRPRARGE